MGMKSFITVPEASEHSTVRPDGNQEGAFAGGIRDGDILDRSVGPDEGWLVEIKTGTNGRELQLHGKPHGAGRRDGIPEGGIGDRTFPVHERDSGPIDRASKDVLDNDACLGES
jgi:hypothetical protein